MSLSALADAATLVDLAGLLEPGEIDGFSVDYLDWGHYRPEYWRNHLHLHSYYEVCLAYSGSGTFTCSGQEHRVAAGDAFLARPGEVHQIVSDTSDPLGIAFWGFSMTSPDAAMSSRLGWWSGLFLGDHPVVSQELGTLPMILHALAREAAAPRSGYSPLLASLGAALVVETGRAFTHGTDLEVGRVGPDRTVPAVAAMERYLRDNLGHPVTVDEVARSAHLSGRHAERLFTGATGTTIMTRLRQLRLERGAALLLETDAQVGAIARECGYGQVRPFITAFRRHFGQPPGAFRRSGGTVHLGVGSGGCEEV